MDQDSSLPTFEEVLTRLDLGPARDTGSYDATIRRRDASASPDGPATLPTLGVTLHGDDRVLSRGTETDLQVGDLIGRGGMGEVWLARQRSLARDVAIKITLPHEDAVADSALVTEGRITGGLEHPSIVPVHALGRAASGRAVLVMKRIEGVAWRDLMQSPTHPHWSFLGPDEPLVTHLQILMQVCNALEFAHRRGVVHRDIKPANVMVGAFGEVYLVDWGLAVDLKRQRADESRLEGTPAYMAPEMIADRPVNARTDVYLLGATLHEVLTGAPPHTGRSLAEVLEQGLGEGVFDYAEAPEELASLCRDAMRRNPSARPETARAFRDRLAMFLSHRSAAAILKRGQALLDESRRAPEPANRTLLEECLVTLRLALAEWPESPSAQAALDEWRVLSFTMAIEDGIAETARRLLGQITEPPPEMRIQLADLEQRLAREQQEATLGRQAAFDDDVRVGARARRVFGVLLLLGIALIASVSIPRSARGSVSAGEIVAFAAGPSALFVILVGVLRRRLLANQYARRTVAVLGLILSVILAHRTVAWLADRPAEATLAADMLLVAGVCAMGGTILARWWFIGAAVALAGALLGTWNPELAGPSFSATALSIASIGVISWWRDARAPAAKDEKRV